MDPTSNNGGDAHLVAAPQVADPQLLSERERSPQRLAPASPEQAESRGTVLGILRGTFRFLRPLVGGLVTWSLALLGGLTAFAAVVDVSVQDWLVDTFEDHGIDPTEAIVTGQVIHDSVGVTGVVVLLYDRDRTWRPEDCDLYKGYPDCGAVVDDARSDSSGYFQFNDVGAGSYNAVAYWNGTFIGRNTFAVFDSQEEVESRVIAVNTDLLVPRDWNLQLAKAFPNPSPDLVFPSTQGSPRAAGRCGPTVIGTPTVPTNVPSDDQGPSLRYRATLLPTLLTTTLPPGVYGNRVTVGLVGTPEELASVASVKFILPPELYSPNTTVTFASDSFELTFDAWASFNVFARVTSTDSSVRLLSVAVILGGDEPSQYAAAQSEC